MYLRTKAVCRSRNRSYGTERILPRGHDGRRPAKSAAASERASIRLSFVPHIHRPARIESAEQWPDPSEWTSFQSIVPINIDSFPARMRCTNSFHNTFRVFGTIDLLRCGRLPRKKRLTGIRFSSTSSDGTAAESIVDSCDRRHRVCGDHRGIGRETAPPAFTAGMCGPGWDAAQSDDAVVEANVARARARKTAVRMHQCFGRRHCDWHFQHAFLDSPRE
jgi:hypothetical protein